MDSQADGKLVSIEETINVVEDTGFKFERYGAVIQFFDNSRYSADTEIEITSSLTQITTVDRELHTRITNSAKDETSTQVGGEVTGDGDVQGLKIGIKVNGSFSRIVENAIEREISKKLSVNFSTTTSYSEKQDLVLKAGKVTVVTSSWQRKFITGTVSLGRDSYPYHVTLGYLGSFAKAEYLTIETMPPELVAEYRRQFPNNGTMSWQDNWRFCSKCHGLHFGGGDPKSCPAGGTHVKNPSGNYTFGA